MSNGAIALTLPADAQFPIGISRAPWWKLHSASKVPIPVYLGSDGLLSVMQQFALASIDGAKDDQIPDADETLLEILADKLRIGPSPMPGELGELTKEFDSATFDRGTARTVTNRLKPYGILARKVDRRREYRDTTLANLARFQRHCGIDLARIIHGYGNCHPCVEYQPEA